MGSAALEHPDLAVLRRAADAVGQRLTRVADWGFSGGRAGQYAVDVAVDDVVIAVLHDAGFAVVSEESGRSGDGDRIVVVDPLDGSTNASRGIPWFATSLCIVDDDGPAVALVANQATGQRFEAVRGGGAWVDGRRSVPSGRSSLDGAVIGISGLPASGTAWGWWQFRALGAAALDLGLVAAGSLDGWVDMSDDAHGCWDYLAGVLLCTEAGACVVDVDARDLVTVDPAERRTPVAAATPALLDELLGYRRR